MKQEIGIAVGITVALLVTGAIPASTGEQPVVPGGSLTVMIEGGATFAATVADALPGSYSPDAGERSASGSGEIMPGDLSTTEESGGNCLSSSAPALERCDSGGSEASTCKARCNRLLGAYYTTCEVHCRDGYYACCGCNDGAGASCGCLLKNYEIWPLEPTDGR